MGRMAVFFFYECFGGYLSFLGSCEAMSSPPSSSTLVEVYIPGLFFLKTPLVARPELDFSVFRPNVVS